MVEGGRQVSAGESAEGVVMQATVSVVIPTYNRRELLQRAVASVLGQTRPADELIVVDDGSSDGTGELFSSPTDSVRYVVKENGGVSSARNVGLAQSRGDYIGLLDSDDEWTPTWLAKTSRVLDQDPTCGVVCSGVSWVVNGRAETNSTLDHLTRAGRVDLPSLFSGRLALGSNFLMRRSALEAVGEFDELLTTAEDIDYALRSAAHCVVRVVPEPLVRITVTPGSLSSHLNTGNRLRVLDKFESEFPELALRHRRELRKARAGIALSYSRDLTWGRSLPAAADRAIQSWRYSPSAAALLQLLKIAALRLGGVRQGRTDQG
jgi:glycosyltransferase involved in cell wall biosynthesis